MRAPAAVLVLASACSFSVLTPAKDQRVLDCTDHYVAPIADAVLFAATVTALGLIATRETECEAIDCLGLPFAIAGVIAFPISALHGFDVVHHCRVAKAGVVRDEARVQREERRRMAWLQTKEAAVAARAGACEDVRRRSAIVRDLDSEFHAAVFVRDVAIAACLVAP